MDDQIEVPEIGSKWDHDSSGAVYCVIAIANRESTRPDDYPITVVYQNTHTDSVWSRPLADWHRSMSLSKYLN